MNSNGVLIDVIRHMIFDFERKMGYSPDLIVLGAEEDGLLQCEASDCGLIRDRFGGNVIEFMGITLVADYRKRNELKVERVLKSITED